MKFALKVSTGFGPWLASCLGVAASAQERARSESPSAAPAVEAAEVATQRQLVTGRVCLQDGSPVAGATIEASSGESTTSSADGSFALALEMPRDVAQVELTASLEGSHSADLGATVHVVPTALTPTTSVGRLVLAPTPRLRWLPTFENPPGVDGVVHALATFDDGSGLALYAGGQFSVAGGTNASRIAKWNGKRWSALGSGVSAGEVIALAAFDDGSGPALYAGGTFTTAGGAPASHIAKWDGASWSAMGSGADSYVFELRVFDDGSGPALYAGGYFTSIDGVAANRIAKWDGASWSALGGGLSGPSGSNHVACMTLFDDGDGPALYAGGYFEDAGGVSASNIARWDGSSWSALGAGVNSIVQTLAVYDDGSGPALYAGGQFELAGAASASHIAKWNGSSWSAVGSGLSATVDTLEVFDDGSGPALHAGGIFVFAGGVTTRCIAKWDGASWSALGIGMVGSLLTAVRTLAVYDAGDGPKLYAGGDWDTSDGLVTRAIARWNGSNWDALGHGLRGTVHALGHPDSSTLLVGGNFNSAGVVTTRDIAAWNGSSWAALGIGLGSTNTERVNAVAVFDDGGGPALYAAGSFTSADGTPASRIAKWDGAAWSPLGSGLAGTALALAVFDDGSGPALFVGGVFLTAGGVAVNQIARWDGASWSSLGSGMNDDVRALTVHDDGSGPALYAAGDFTTAGGVAANRIARWNGTSWSKLGTGANTTINALTVFDDGSGPALYAGGRFTGAGGTTAPRIARWNGSSWSALGTGVSPGEVLALAVHDDGRGVALYAGGNFTSAGGLAANRIAKWDGSRWSALMGGLPDDVQALASFDDGDGPALYAGGDFLTSPSGDSYLAKWGRRRHLGFR